MVQNILFIGQVLSCKGTNVTVTLTAQGGSGCEGWGSQIIIVKQRWQFSARFLRILKIY